MADLNTVSVASACTADWDAMRGDDRVRFCDQCELNVYNLSALSRSDAEAFVREQTGEVCVRFYKRADGTLLTQDCPVGLRAALRRKLSWLAGVAASLLAAVGGMFAGLRSPQQAAATTPRPLPLATVQTSADVGPEPEWIMGEVEVCPPVEEPETCEDEPEPEPVRPRMGRMVAPR